MKDGLVSIITPTYNCGSFIGETIEAVQAQTYSDWEMIIVDDCSTDDTESVVQKYCQDDPRVCYYKMPVNSGTAMARTRDLQMDSIWLSVTVTICGLRINWKSSCSL